ncbi:MAG TPA: class I SAM-dependent methyltransferase [Ktedonobacteraceae bacterium]|nr:class I SAM-dependent methyltransferase [Ktedonobacteraceae bacterium]
MATREQIEATYNYMDEVFRVSLGENGDLTCALYNGDFSKTLQQAQQDKHSYILDAIHFQSGSRVLDIGCGWGPILKAVKERGGQAIGLTLSTKQAETCQRGGLEAYVKDWKEISVDTFGPFDGIVSVGAFEHFCSVEEYLAGKQEAVYDHFFRLCHDLLPERGRLYLQTMMWGKQAPDYHSISLQATRGSSEYILAVLEKFYPGSWLPRGEEQIVRVAKPYFELISDNNGRLDYIETMKQWQKATQLGFSKALAFIKTLPYFFTDRDFRYKLEALHGNYNRECFKREIMDHQRMVFEKR